MFQGSHRTLVNRENFMDAYGINICLLCSKQLLVKGGSSQKYSGDCTIPCPHFVVLYTCGTGALLARAGRGPVLRWPYTWLRGCVE